MFKDWSLEKSGFRSGSPRLIESESYSANAVYRQGQGVRCGGGIEKGNPSWSRATVFHPCAPRKRPSQADRAPDVAITRAFAPIRSVLSLVERTHAPIAPEMPVCITGIFAGIRTDNKKGERPQGETALVIATRVERRFSAYVAKAKPSKSEASEVAYRRKAKATETSARLEAKAKAIALARKAQDADKLEQDRKAARMEYRRNLSRMIRLSIVSDLV
jgi:hypothetical protein